MRQTFFKQTLGLALLTSAFMLSAPAQAKTTLYVGMNGGTMQKAYEDHIFPAFEKEHDVDIVVVPGTSTDVLAKAQAAKSNPQMHVMFLDDGVMYRAISMGLCDKIEDQNTLDNLYSNAIVKDGYAAAIEVGLTGLAYNTKTFEEKGWDKPTSWADLADSKFKNQVVFQSPPDSTFGLDAMLMLNEIWGGDINNVKPFFEKFADEVGKNVVAYIPNSSKISEMTQTGEASLFPLTPTAVGVLKEKGLPVEYADPKEGSVLLLTAECVIANNTEPELSQKLASYLLSKSAQVEAVKHAHSFPANKLVADEESVKDNLKNYDAYMENAVMLDWDVINKNRPKWNRQWRSKIEK